MDKYIFRFLTNKIYVNSLKKINLFSTLISYLYIKIKYIYLK